MPDWRNKFVQARLIDLNLVILVMAPHPNVLNNIILLIGQPHEKLFVHVSTVKFTNLNQVHATSYQNT